MLFVQLTSSLLLGVVLVLWGWSAQYSLGALLGLYIVAEIVGPWLNAAVLNYREGQRDPTP